jgi:type II secretory pathway component PulK
MTVAQLFLIKGLKDIERFGEKRLEDFLTIHGDGKININTAPHEILMSLDKEIDSAVAQSIIDYRSAENFTGPSDLSKVPGIDREVLDRISQWLTVNSSAFSIELKVTYSEAVSHLKAVALRYGDKSSLKYYRIM